MAKETYPEIREAVAKLSAQFPGRYWRELDRQMAYPSAFVTALTDAGYLSVLIPEAFGGAGLSRRRCHRSRIWLVRLSAGTILGQA